MLRLVLAFLLSMLAAAAHGDELAERKAIFDEVHRTFLNEDFARLDKWADEWRVGPVRTDSGFWKLGHFYSTFTHPEYVYVESSDLGDFDRNEARIDRWRSANPASIAAPIVKAKTIAARAWHQRGYGYIGSVTEAGMRGFLEDMRRAHEVLMQARDGSMRDPAWYESLLFIYMATGQAEKFEHLAEEALALHPGYFPIYSAIMYHNLPQWGGNMNSIEQAARQISAAAARIGEADEAYTRAYLTISDEPNISERFFSNTASDWASLKKGFTKIVQRYPTPLNLNNFARFSCRGIDPESALALLDRIGPDIVPEAWAYPQQAEDCQQWASHPQPSVVGKPDRPEPIFVLVAFDKGPDGNIAPALESASHPTEEHAIAEAEGLVAAHAGVAVWRVMPKMAGDIGIEPETLFQQGDTLSFEEMYRQARAKKK